MRVDQSQLDTDDVFIADLENLVLVWVGENASPIEMARSMSTASKYLGQYKDTW